jgi:hypothetical protein
MYTMIKARRSTRWSQAFSKTLSSRANETHGTVRIKPAMETPLTAMRRVELAIEAGIPAGALIQLAGLDLKTPLKTKA